VGKRKFYKINQYISAKEVRVIGSDNKQIGVIPTNEALKEARKQGLDLVEISAQVKPPVCKILDFRKFIYQLKKKRLDSKRKKKTNLKEIRLKLFIDEHDLKRRIQTAEKFLKKGRKVKFSLLFRGREITKKEFGKNLFKNIVEALKESAKTLTEPKVKGKILEMTLLPKTNIKNKNAKT
jgi:translation initiation factor IF-3